MLSYAETLSWRDVFDNVMECLTIYTWPILFPSKYQKALEHLTEFIETQNQEVYQPLGICITPPVRVAFLYVSEKQNKRRGQRVTHEFVCSWSLRCLSRTDFK
ncbi:hypothetical protein BDF14DRAFT_1716497 [Spinellus fusiger]|nr:hypothetical protein BDF14DRAFT_1716497 [Spinellus fusiger]